MRGDGAGGAGAGDPRQALAGRHPNFILSQDTSGADRVALSGLELEGVFLVRGAEGGYDRWTKPAGPYDGCLLSTANTFAAELHEVQALLAAGRRRRRGG